MSMQSRIPRWAPCLALLLMGLLMVASAKDDTVTTDENLMIGVGDLLLKERKFKVGFEHPPLMRDIVAAPLLFMDLKPASSFIDAEVSRNLSDYAFNFGEKFLLGQNEPPEKILMAARLPAILMTLLLGYLLFHYAFAKFGGSTGYLTLALYLSSPFFLAHGRLTTMDVPMALFSFLSIWQLFRLLDQMKFKNALLLGFALGGALLIKFPMASLVPFLVAVYFFHCFWFKRSPLTYFKYFGVVFLVSLFSIYGLYWLHLMNYPATEHLADMQQTLALTRSYAIHKYDWIIQLAQIEPLRPLAHYFYGLFWQLHRSGAFGYFMGEGSIGSWMLYYPFGFLVKNPLPVVILFAFSIVFGLNMARKVRRETFAGNFETWAWAAWIVYYLFILIFVNSGNTGSRYLIPILPAVFMLSSAAAVSFLNSLTKKPKQILVAGLAIILALQFLMVYRAHPSYLSYFSILIGDSETGANYLVDTDVEWGQDVKRLADWAAAKDIRELNVAIGFDYSFQNGTATRFNNTTLIYEHYLKDRFRPYTPDMMAHGWLAVPGRLLKWGQTVPASKLGWSSSSYRFLEKRSPVAIIGGSIWVYYLE